MALHSTLSIPERILLTGAAGVGKTFAWLQIAQWAQNTGSDAIFYALDTDKRAVERTLALEFPDLRNVVVVVCRDWETLSVTAEEFAAKARPQDWIVVDMIGNAWQMVQTYERQVRTGVKAGSVGKAMIALAADAKAKKQDRKEIDWNAINGAHADFVDSWSYADCHALVVSGIKIPGDTDDKSIRVVWGPHAVKPEGQKALSHAVQTALIVGADKPKQPYITTVKDRGRSVVERMAYADFCIEYLVSLAGWEL